MKPTSHATSPFMKTINRGPWHKVLCNQVSEIFHRKGVEKREESRERVGGNREKGRSFKKEVKGLLADVI